MDHGDHTMSGMSPTMTPTPEGTCECSQSSSAEMDMGHEGMGGGCYISMLLNYNVVDSCFLSSNWRISSTGMFAGSCIGIALLAIFLEFLRRAVKEFDRFLLKQHIAKHSAKTDGRINATGKGCEVPVLKPNFWQQAVRAILHTSQFVVAYFVMLLAMYFNVYVLVSIFLGILVGSYIFQYDSISSSKGNKDGNQEPTVCCG